MIPLLLNEYNVRQNAVAGAHDPGMMWDPVTKRYYSYCTDANGKMLGVDDYIGIPVRSSPDLVSFTYHGSTLSKGAIQQGRNNGPHFPATRNFWAPFVEYAGNEYRMYYSATRAFGSSESRIWLATSDHPLGPFENRGVVADTWGTDDTLPNAIDPHIVRSGDQVYLVYGSFFGGIYIKELDPATGLCADGEPKNLGACISRRPRISKLDGPEGASVIFVPETGWFYLFQSYGWLGDTYDIRVGRSRCVTGPYVDRKGRCLMGDSLGEKIAGSYRFRASAPLIGNADAGWEWGGLRGPGHGVPFFDPNRQAYFFVHHIRDGAMVNSSRDPHTNIRSFRRFYMMVRPMFFLEGWPVLSPEPFGGESLESQHPVSGTWELIRFDHENNRQKRSEIVKLSADHPLLTGGRLLLCPDLENGGECLAVTGCDEHENPYWGKLCKQK